MFLTTTPDDDTLPGYIPGEMYGCLPFFFFLAVTYLTLGVVWMGLSMAYIKVTDPQSLVPRTSYPTASCAELSLA